LSLVEPLSNRELAVLQLLAAGLSNREIAEELYLSINTVKTHTKSIYGKLNVRSRTQAANRARELGLL
jgi:LuxR family maltose regulon positive regulatory protein